MVIMTGMFLMVGAGIVMHHQKRKKAERGIHMAMLLIMIGQLNPPGRLIDTKARQQTAAQH